MRAQRGEDDSVGFDEFSKFSRFPGTRKSLDRLIARALIPDSRESFD